MIDVLTYEDLAYYFKLFQVQKPNLMVVMSKGGTGKTTLAESLLKGAKFLRGHVTPLAFYRELTELRDDDVEEGEKSNKTFQLVLDDIDLFKSAVMIGQLKQATDTKEEQSIGYLSTHHMAEMLNKEISRKLSTLILLNRVDLEKNADLQAIGDRGHCIFFKPSNEEIVNYAEEHKVADTDIIQFIRKYQDVSENVSLRTFKKAMHHKAMSGDPWKPRVLREMMINEKYLEIIKLIGLFKKDTERIKNYKWSRRDYYRQKKKLSALVPDLEKHGGKE